MTFLAVPSDNRANLFRETDPQVIKTGRISSHSDPRCPSECDQKQAERFYRPHSLRSETNQVHHRRHLPSCPHDHINSPQCVLPWKLISFPISGLAISMDLLYPIVAASEIPSLPQGLTERPRKYDRHCGLPNSRPTADQSSAIHKTLMP